MSARTLSGIALLSAAGLMLELSLVRVLSVLYFYTYVYVVLSIAVLGIGLGAALASWQPWWRAPERLPLWALLAGGSSFLLTVFAVQTAPFDLRILVLTLTTLPYVFMGLALATAFSNHAEESPTLYWADLGGAGLGTLAAVPLLNALGGINGMLSAALLLGVSSLLFYHPRRLSVYLVPVLALGLALLGNLQADWLQIDLHRLALPKPIGTQLQAGATIVETRWDAFARTDLVYRPDSDAYYLYVDGGAGSVVPDPARPEAWGRDIGAFPFVANHPTSALLIGPGGGLDVALAQAAGTERIVAVEINAASVALVQGLEPYAGAPYGAGVEVLVDEGRSALRRSEERFDLILLSQVVTQTAEVRGYALTENSVYTVEAFHNYLEHLTPQGSVALKLYDELTLTRALTTAVQTLRERGHSDAEAAQHLFVLLDLRVTPPIPLLLIRNAPIERPEAIRLARVAESMNLGLLFIPGLLARPPLDGLLEGRTTLESLVEAAAEVDLRPTTDDWPFFYSFEPGLPEGLRGLAYGLGVILALGTLFLIFRQRRQRARVPRWSPLLFALLGLGFMMTEISLLQRTQLFLGHPTLTLSVVLGTLLIGGGLGSLLAGRASRGRERTFIALSGVGVAGGLVLWLLLWPPLSEALRGAHVAVRVLLTILSLCPLALLLGVPFPLTLRVLGRYGAAEVALGWAVNGVMSVAGTVLALVVALSVGFGGVTLAGVVCYSLLPAVMLLMTPASA